MTQKERRFEEFMERCVHVDDESFAGATRIEGGPDRRREADRFQKLSKYHREAAQDNLEGRAPLMAIREGYYVMLHKGNEAIALAGFKARNHECTLMGVRGLFNAPGLADLLRRARQERANVDYFMDPENPELQEFAGAREFVDDVVDPFVERVEALIEEEDLR